MEHNGESYVLEQMLGSTMELLTIGTTIAAVDCNIREW
jgi:hypothetical protein